MRPSDPQFNRACPHRISQLVHFQKRPAKWDTINNRPLAENKNALTYVCRTMHDLYNFPQSTHLNGCNSGRLQ
jgi:hypothetical protein